MGAVKFMVILAVGFLCYSATTSIPRDDSGRIKPSPAQRREFMLKTGYPNGRPRYVVDFVPTEGGGCNDPRNMQWQTIEDAREKDRWE